MITKTKKSQQTSRNRKRAGLKVTTFLILILLSTFALPSCNKEPTAIISESTSTGGNLRVALGKEPDKLDPPKTVFSESGRVMDMIFDRLVYIGPDGLPKPWLAESWEISDQGKMITFKLRSGIKFHDGTPVNAEAIKFSFERTLDEKGGSANKALLGSLESIQAADELTAVFKFREPFAPFFTNISQSFGGAIVSPTAVQKHGDQFGRNPVGSGPFKFKSWETGTKIVLERNPDYINHRDDLNNKNAPYLDQITFLIISGAPTQVAALESGALDIANLQVENAQRISEDDRFNVVQKRNTSSLVFLDFADKEPFSSLAFRRAISHAIDRDKIVDYAASGYATANRAPLPNGVAGWNDSLDSYPYDPALARSILSEDGWTTGANGILEKDGKPASYTLLASAGDTTIKRTTEIIQSNLKEIGIDVKVSILESSVAGPARGKGDFELTIVNIIWPDPAFLSIVYKSDTFLIKRGEDKDLDAILDKANAAMDPAQHAELVQVAQEMILDTAKVVPLYSPWVQIAVNKKVQGFKLDALGTPQYLDVSISN